MTPAPPTRPLEGSEEGAGVSRSAPRQRNLRAILWAALPLGVLGTLIALDLPICPSRILLGIPCPGCGLTRATEAMVVGDLATMVRMHPFAPILAPLAVWSIGRSVAVSAGLLEPMKLDPLRRVPSAVWGVLGVALVGFWVARAAGLFGGLPDPLDVTRGLLWRGGAALWDLLPKP